MPKLEKVMVCVGGHPSPHLPKQSYESLVTEYNVHVGIKVLTDPQLFNKNLSEYSDADIYGFMPGNYYYSSRESLQQIVDVFNMGNDMEVITADTIIKKKSLGAEFIEYHHSEEIYNAPFFVTAKIAKEVQFEQKSGEMFKDYMTELVRRGNMIYHIADPLFTAEMS